MIINNQTDLGGAEYPFLTPFNWEIVTTAIELVNPDELPKNAILHWVKDDSLNSLFIADETTESFFHKTGLNIQISKSPYVSSKRLSRIFRPYFIWGEFNDLNIQYLKQTETEKKIWDGAGRVNRRVLRSLINQLPPFIKKSKKQALSRELESCQRIEVTIMSPKGQDKCHAIVFEEDAMEEDFILPEDTKIDVSLSLGYMVALTPVSGHPNDVRIDIQTLINNWGFWQLEDLKLWLHQEGCLFLESIKNNQIGAAMSRLDSSTTLKEVTAWHVREYFVSGGNALWFGGIIRDLVDQQINRLEYQGQKFKLPIPGGRFYIMADTIGSRHVPEGHIELDARANTAWVNHRDWTSYIAMVLGGADQDDALITFPFTDYDGEQKVFICRNPNQLGEYIILKPTENSYTIEWETIESSISYPAADSRKLPIRIDHSEQCYLNLVDEEKSNLYQGPYQHFAMNSAITRAQENAGVLGLYCNLLMVVQAIYGRMPKQAPAPLEVIIDSSVKTGAPLGLVRNWIMEAGQTLIQKQVPVPKILRGRIPHPEGSKVSNPKTNGHWIDTIEEHIKAHITWLKTMRDELMKEAMPPIDLFAAVIENEKLMARGAQFNAIHARSLKESKNQELARARCETFLSEICGEDIYLHEAVILAACASYYLNNREGKDGAVWQMGKRTESGRDAGIAQIMLQALRGIGILNEITEENERVLRYPSANIRETAQTIFLNGVWFNLAVATWQGSNIPKTMAELDREQQNQFKGQVATINWKGLELNVRDEDGRKKVYTPKGNLFAYLEKGHEETVGTNIKILYAIEEDGNLKAILKAI